MAEAAPTTSTSTSISLKERVQEQWAKVSPYVKKVWPLLILLLLYFLVVFRRVPRAINATASRIQPQLGLRSISDNASLGGAESDVRLCDVYVASSYKSYLPCSYMWDYASVDAVAQVIRCGARLVDLDIYNYTFQESSTVKPMVYNGWEVGQFPATTRVAFEDCVIAAMRVAFDSKQVGNYNDPLFFRLNFRTWGNRETIDHCARIIKHHCEQRLLSSEYAYQGRNAGKSLATAFLKDLVGKVIIFSSGNIEGTAMDELTNLSLTNSTYNARLQTYDDYLRGEDVEEVQQFNSKHISVIEPDTTGARQFVAENFFTAMCLGAQFMCMPYFASDTLGFLQQYIEIFKGSSFVLKPKKLRYHPVTIPQPRQQNEAVSFAPKVIQMPGMTLTY
jgi:hypothetical protein